MPRRAGRRGDGRCAVAEAEPPAGGEGGGKSGSAFGFLGHKVFGKVPVWVIAVAAVGAYYWYTKYGPGKKNAAAQGTQGTDPAGNTGTIDPATGFVYGSPGTWRCSPGHRARRRRGTTRTGRISR